jgi:hypothetical protein
MTGTKHKVLVAIKRALDYNARVRVKPDKVRNGGGGGGGGFPSPAALPGGREVGGVGVAGRSPLCLCRRRSLRDGAGALAGSRSPAAER